MPQFRLIPLANDPNTSPVLHNVPKRRWGLFLVVLTASLVPYGLSLFGVSFAVEPGGIAGPIVHSLLEWSAVIPALLVGILSILHYGVKRQPVTPIIGLALLAAGFMDAFHTLAAGHIIQGAADSSNFIPFTWAISRLFNAVIMLAGVGLILFKRNTVGLRGPKSLTGVGLSFAVFAYAVIYLCATTAVLPQTMFAGAVITRPWDLAPLILFVFAGLTVYPKFVRLYPSHFAKAVWIGVIPEIASQLHMTFGSVALFDHHFNIAHALKILAHLIPLVGLLFDWAETYSAERVATGRLDKALAKWEQLARSASDVVIRIDRRGRIDFLSRDLDKVEHGPTVGALAGNWMAPDFHDNYLELLKSVREDGLSRKMEARAEAAGGQDVWFRCKLTLDRDDASIIMSLSDITGSKEDEKTMRRLASMVERTGEAIISVSKKGLIDTWNKAAERLLGYTNEEVFGHPVSMLAPEELKKNHSQLVQRMAAGFKIKPAKTVLVSKGGTTIDVQVAFTRLLDEDAEFNGAVAVIRDVRQEQVLERTLLAAKESAEEANVQKSRFLANMSHEIRTPLNGVVGMIQLLKDTALNEEQEDFVDTLGTSSHALLIVINDILDYSKIDAGHLALDYVPFDLRRVVRETSASFGGAVRQRELALETEFESGVPQWVEGDPHRVRQVLSNLIGNAVKFTKQGGIRLKVTLDGTGTDSEKLRFEVSDTGVGMAKGTLGRIFAPFVQADGSTTRNFGGTGLGLTICKSLSEKMGGEIGARSELGAGSTFWFTVSCTRVEAPTEKVVVDLAVEHSVSAKAGSRKILVAEDNPINRKVIKKLLERSGCKVELVCNGAEAVAAVAAGDYDLVLMDCQMPVMGGFEATEKIRKSAGHPDVPIVALTAQALDGDREKCLAVGMDDYLAKPVAWSELTEILNRWLGGMERELRARKQANGDRAPRPGSTLPVSSLPPSSSGGPSASNGGPSEADAA